MSAFEGSYKSLLQGVSQQVPRERLPGQVTAQDNMLADTVTNVRRRPGTPLKATAAFPGETGNTIFGMFTDLGGRRVHVLIGGNTGKVLILNQQFTTEYTMTFPYLVGATQTTLRAAVVGQDLYIMNTKKAPAIVPVSAVADQNNKKRGFFTVVAGAYSRQYVVHLTIQGVGTYVASYTTPDVTTPGAAAASSATAIAQALATSLQTQRPSLGVEVSGTSVALTVTEAGNAWAASVTSPSGTAYVLTSGAQEVRNESMLAPNLGNLGNGIVMAVGSEKAKIYYQYNSARAVWNEVGSLTGGVANLTNMPVSLGYVAGVGWSSYSGVWPGRLAGDEETNPMPEFINYGVTGMGAHQGRLVILAGPFVSMSDTRDPQRFYRSTVATLLDSDCIHVAASANSSAAYEWCTPFQKDLLLFSSAYQALIPSGNSGLTPRNAAVLLTSTYSADTLSGPVSLGRTVMYPAPRSQSFYGVKEMLPSTYTDSQYTSTDATPHLPKYMPGRCRFSASSNTSNIVIFGSTGDSQSLIVHEYLWAGEEKVQQAWHRWEFEHPIAYAYFAEDQLVLLFYGAGGTLLIVNMDPRSGLLSSGSERQPYLDIFTTVNMVDNKIPIPAAIALFDPEAHQWLYATLATGPLAGDEVGLTARNYAELTASESFSDGPVFLGYPFRSSLIPTPPMVKDENDVKVSTNKLTILRYVLSVRNSSEFEVVVRDSNVSDAATASPLGTVYWTSRELEPDKPRVAMDSVVQVPMRTNADTTTFMITTDGQGDMNIVGMEYLCRYNQRIRRR